MMWFEVSVLEPPPVGADDLGLLTEGGKHELGRDKLKFGRRQLHISASVKHWSQMETFGQQRAHSWEQ